LKHHIISIALTGLFAFSASLVSSLASAAPEDRQLLFGDTHLHTSWSPDASLMGNRSADPDTAYRFAKGLPVIHPKHRARVQIETPLDFLAVSDHAEFMGVIPMILSNDPRVSGSDTAKRFIQLAKEGRANEGMMILVDQVQSGNADPALISEEVTSSVWAEIVAAAERHNDPGRFTTLLAWEWSSMPNMANLHRVVVLREGKEVADQFAPLSSLEDSRPESLWAWLEATSERTGAHFIAMPHNSNISLGQMFEMTKSNGEPIDAEYARTRARWESVVEITQVKGDSETHPSLSPTDEFASYEKFGDLNGVSKDRGADFVRSALRRGLEIEARIGVNPYDFGISGATDTHTGLSTSEETNFLGKFANPSTPEANLAPSRGGAIRGINLGAAGLAAVWAEANTREAIYDAFARKETYATTGTRIGLRFFGGWRYSKRDLESQDFARRGYKNGVAMGGTLPARDEDAPRFLIEAHKDPAGANLDRIQVIKGWVDETGRSHERIYNVALADERKVGSDGLAPAVGNTVNLATGTYENSIGDTILTAFWRDPDFDAGAAAFYYVRVLEIPTPRHSLLDAIAVDIPHEEGFPKTIQERAYSSPIYYKAESM
jgi:hypothetical protein